MRIIDKYHDTYDYMQDPTDTLVFDRRGSFELTKDEVCRSISTVRRDNSKYRFLVLQCGATYWLILLTITARDTLWPTNYTLEFLSTWKNFNRKRNLIKLSVIDGWFPEFCPLGYRKDYDYDKIKKNISSIQQRIDTEMINYAHTIAEAEYTYRDWRTEEVKDAYKPPLLKSTGLFTVIDPMEVFLAIEEHFSLIKTEAERTEAIGTTNNDKIVSHGFDLKTSFRGKNK